MDNTSTHVVMSALRGTPSEAAIDAIRKSIKLHSQDAQLLHMIIANIIKSQNKWKAVISVFRQQDIDDIPDPAITYAHLPRKYEDLYDDLLPEVDQLNLIDDDTVWANIKRYLLNVYFYQAANFKVVERIDGETGGGYFEEKDGLNTELELESELTLDAHTEGVDTTKTAGKLFNNSFYKAVSLQQEASSQARQDSKSRNLSDPKTKQILRQLRITNTQ